MKTPKRKHYDIFRCHICLGYGISYEINDSKPLPERAKCKLCGNEFPIKMFSESDRARSIRNRWKRRNREARLRNLIHWQAEDIKWFKGTLKERTVARDWLVVCYRELSRKHDLEGDTFNASGTYGHDIEGS